MNKALVVLATIFMAPLLWFATASTADAAVAKIAWPKDVIYVYDTTAALHKSNGSQVWAVRAAAERWDNGSPLDFRYTSKGCPKGAQCVTVRQANLASPAVGVTSTVFVGNTIKSSSIILDTTLGRKGTSAQRRNVICHELGHSLGLQHRAGTSSCMTSYLTNTRYPDKTDIKILNTMYH